MPALRQPALAIQGIGQVIKTRALPYLGGKARNVGEWINSNLPPPHARQHYTEPFAGMLGVMRRRAPAGLEWASDIDGHVVNWWRMVRDRGQELDAALERTPHAEAEWKRARTELNDPDPLRRAINFAIVMLHSYGSNTRSSTFVRSKLMTPPRIDGLRKRMANVILIDEPAEKLLERIVDRSQRETLASWEHLVYCDPPYPSAKSTDHYQYSVIDIPKISELLLAISGPVAISGYGSEWDHLGWRCEEFVTRTDLSSQRQSIPRTEKLWCNFPPIQARLW